MLCTSRIIWIHDVILHVVTIPTYIPCKTMMHTGKQRLKYGTVALTVSLRSGSSGIPRPYFDEFSDILITQQAFIVCH